MWIWALIALVLMLVAGVLCVIRKTYELALIAFGLAAYFVPAVIDGIR